MEDAQVGFERFARIFDEPLLDFVGVVAYRVQALERRRASRLARASYFPRSHYRPITPPKQRRHETRHA